MVASIYKKILIFKKTLSFFFPPQFTKGNIVLIDKKGDKQVFKNYCPISLLPICGGTFGD